MRISVALATYNGQRFIGEQLGSLLSQTHMPFELVVRDDGSTDDTLSIVEQFAKAAPFPVTILLADRRLGFEDNFLRAAQACCGDYIAMCDQDDIWLPGKLATCAERLRNDKSLIALHTMTLIDDSSRAFGHWGQGITGDRVFEPLELDPYLTGWGNSMVFAREIVHILPNERRPHQPEFPERPMSHDTWIYILAAALGRVSHIAAPLILYRQHGSNALGVSAWKKENAAKKALQVPIFRWKEHAKANYAISRMLDSLQDERAKKAAARMYERADLLSARVNQFLDLTLSDRILAFKAYHKSERPAPSTFSKLKAWSLGVAGLGRVVPGLFVTR